MSNFQLIFFIIALVCAVPVLYWYYRRQPNSRFRPRFGEMVMVGIFIVMFSWGGSMLIGGLMDDPEQLKGDGGMSTMPGMPSATGESEDEDEESGKGEKSRKGEGSGRGSGSGGGLFR